MFGLFKKKELAPDSLEKQLADIKILDPLIANEILKGINCDKLPNASGYFGSITNPIPVNGPWGEIKYLGKLRGKTGHRVFFHRICSLSSPVTTNPVDVYELVCQDGTQWNNLYFDYYHPRRSILTPEGYTLTPFDKRSKIDFPYAFGLNSLVTNFPFNLPKELDEYYGSKRGMYSKHAKKFLNQYSFQKLPIKQEDML
jgi:hypothetical protein